MGVKLGSTDINKMLLGGTQINKAYLGGTLIFDTTAGSPGKPSYAYTGGAHSPSGTSNRKRLTDDIDARYKYNNGMSSLIHPSGANTIQVVTYVDEDRRGAVAWRYFPAGSWSTGHDVHTALHAEVDAGSDNNQDYYYPANDPDYPDDAKWSYDSHNKIKIGRCPNSGRLFVCGNNHSNYLKMARSDTGNHSGPWTNVSRNEFNNGLISRHDQAVKRATYPQFFQFKGDLWFSVRLQKSGGGNSYWAWNLYKYDDVNDQWDVQTEIANSDDARCYVSNIAVSPDGNRMGFMAMWRDEAGSGGTAAQRDLFYCESTNGTSWYQRSNTSATTTNVTLPFAWDSVNEVSDVPINIWDTLGNSDPAVSEMELLIDSSYNVHAIVRDLNYDFHYLKHEGAGGWVDDFNPGGFVSSASSTGTLFEFGSVIGWVNDSGDDVVVQVLDSTYDEYDNPYTFITGYGNDNFAVALDGSAAVDGWISCTVSKPDSPTNLSVETDLTVRADTFTIPFSSLLSADYDITNE